jgi:hypothetical protein
MTLCKILEIDTTLIGLEDHAGLGLAERMWTAAGRPTTRRELLVFLERFLLACREHGYLYAKIFLRRKHELQRGDWEPKRNSAAASEPINVPASTSGKIPRQWIEDADRRERMRLGLL